jgi:Ca2+-transporting ATPase
MGYILAVHVPIAGLALAPLLLGLPLVFAPVHIAFLEMVIDPICSIAFEAEAEEADIMARPPRDPRRRLFSTGLVLWSLVQGILALVVVLAIFLAGLGRGMPEPEARALAFVSLIIVNIGLILVNRSFGGPLLAALRRPNRVLWAVLGGTTALLVATFTWPPAERLFHFGPLHPDDLAISLGAGAAVLVLLELAKPLWRRALQR